MEPDGQLVTTDSRRQDQYMTKTITDYYFLYRHMAIQDKSAFFSGVCRLIEGLPEFEEVVVNRGLIRFLEAPELQQELPTAVAPPTDFEKLFAQSHLLRLRRGNTTTTFFGGVDWPLIIASGRSNSPNFYAYRKGAAVLKYLRLSTAFFSTGYFYSKGLQKKESAYILHNKMEVPYYQPLPKKLRKADGDYPLTESIDGRFWNKMDFSNRPVSNVKTLDTTVTLVEAGGGNELQFRVDGLKGVQVTVELCFKEGGTLSGVTTDEKGNGFLENGTGTYAFGGDTITFGPGVAVSKAVENLEGERYSTHFGSLRTEGMHVYLTGVTPFVHTLRFS
jgi:hypothetical protein